MARKRIRHYFGKKKIHRRRKSGIGGGIMSPVVAGAIVGAGAAILAPHIQKYVPSVAGIPPVAVALGGGGLVAKAVLHKDPMHLATAAIIIGVGTAAASMLSGVFVGAAGEAAN